jgi:cysteine desulfurase
MNNQPTPIYLDHAATTPMLREVVDAMAPFFGPDFANPSSIYGAARRTRQAVEDARAKVAELMAAKPTEIVWTSGATEANNLAIQGVLRAHPRAHWVTTTIEHDAVLAQVGPMKRGGHSASVVPVAPNGIVDPADVMRAVTDKTALVSVMLANNEIGTIQPITELSKRIRDVVRDREQRGVKLPLYLHTDAAQAANYIGLHVGRLGIDLLTLSGSKVYGPKGTGLLYVRTGTTLEPLVYGGGQERGRRSGTENVAGIVGLATALGVVQTDRVEEGRWLAELRDGLAKRLAATIPGLILNGDAVQRLPNNLNFTIPGAEGEGLVLYLDQAGIQASTGSACSSGDLDPSHVLLALGRSHEEASCSLRLTFGRSSTADTVEHVATVLPPIVARLRELASS